MASSSATTATAGSAPEAALLNQTVTLPISKQVAPTRLLKAPMEELLSSLTPQLVKPELSTPTPADKSKDDATAASVGNTVLRPAHMPNKEHFHLYRTWARSGWGIIVTGNVCVDPRHLGSPFDISFPQLQEGARAAIEAVLQGKTTAESLSGKTLYKEQDVVLDSFKEYAHAAKGEDQQGALYRGNARPLVVVQLVHQGRQSPRGSGRSPFASTWAPSAVPLRPTASVYKKQASSSWNPFALASQAIDWAMWGVPHAMTIDEIRQMKAQFLAGAYMVQQAGFDGIELHASHGYQLAAFLSPKTNLRTDEYGGDAKRRARLLLELATEIRQLCGKNFTIGIKLNSADYVAGGLTEADALKNIEWIAEAGCVDFIEVSGGSYENPSFLSPTGFDAEAENAKLAAGGKLVKGKPTANGSAAPAAVGSVNRARGSGNTSKREAFFQAFATQSHDVLSKFGESAPIVCVVGGLKTRGGMASVVRDAKADMAGIGRYACVYPDLPLLVLDESIPDDSPAASPQPYTVPAAKFSTLLPFAILGAGWVTAWHGAQITLLARGKKPKKNAGLLTVASELFLPNVSTAFATVSMLGILTAGVLATALHSHPALFGK